MEPRKIESVLVYAPNWVGDIVMATPAFRALRAGLPEARITLLCRSLATKILAGAPWFDEVLPYDRKGADRGFSRAISQIRALRSRHFDLGVLFPNSISSGLLAWAGGCRRRVGYALGRSWLLTHRLFPVREGRLRQPTYMAEYYGELLRFVGLDPGSTKLELFVTSEEEEACRAFLARHGIGDEETLLAINPGASFGASKLWRSDRFAEVADALIRERSVRPIVLCGPGEEHLASEISAQMKGPVVNTAEDLVGLGALKPLMKRVSLLITTDTGARHFAVAFGKPVVVLMGATDPRYTDGNLDQTVIVREPVPCSPCHLRVCPIDHRCMERITAERVIRASLELLDKQ